MNKDGKRTKFTRISPLFNASLIFLNTVRRSESGLLGHEVRAGRYICTVFARSSVQSSLRKFISKL